MSQSEQINTFVDSSVDIKLIGLIVEKCQFERRSLSDIEFKHAQGLNWKLTCRSSKDCPYYRKGIFNATFDPCIECQTDFDDIEGSV